MTKGDTPLEHAPSQTITFLENFCICLRPPHSKNRLFRKKYQNRVFIIERCSSLLFQNIYNFLKKDQVLTDF